MQAVCVCVSVMQPDSAYLDWTKLRHSAECIRSDGQTYETPVLERRSRWLGPTREIPAWLCSLASRPEAAILVDIDVQTAFTLSWEPTNFWAPHARRLPSCSPPYRPRVFSPLS